MQALVIYAHPDPSSFNAAMRDVTTSTLGEMGYSVQVSDLYAMGFKPTIDRDDFATTFDARHFNVTREQRHALEHRGLRDDIQRELDALLAADLVVFHFPLWWFSVPAILKGWFDRVLVSGAVYGRQYVFERGKLAGKRAMLAVTTGGPEAAFGPTAINGDMLDILMPIHRGILGFCGMTVLPPFVGYFVPYVGDGGREKLLAAYASHLRAVEQLAPLPMPRLADHAETLAPLLRTKAE
jgi:NAD(P)H dehydrogenase (quinone)